MVEASLDWEKGTSGNNQTFRLSTSSAFFDTANTTAVTGASVKVTNDISGAVFVFQDQNNGNYTTTEFVPVFNNSYTLEIKNKGETFTANETLKAVPVFDDVYQDI